MGGDSDSNGYRRPHLDWRPPIENNILMEVGDPITEKYILMEDPLIEEDPLEEDILMEMGEPLEEEDTLVEDPLMEMEDPLMEMEDP